MTESSGLHLSREMKMTSLAKYFKIPNEFRVFGVCQVLIGFFCMAIQTFICDNITLLIQLFMSVKHYITFLIVALEAEIRCFAIGHPPERNLIDFLFLALAI